MNFVQTQRHSRIIIAHHLILTGYGHWLANDPRGSLSVEIRKEEFQALGEIHFGRKVKQPPRSELKEFYKKANPLLKYEPLWFDRRKILDIGAAISRVVAARKYTVWACAILSNHAHLCIRRHRDSGDKMSEYFKQETRGEASRWPDVAPDHPLWSMQQFDRFLYDPTEVRPVVQYIQRNPAREGLEPQEWEFIRPYDGWPYAK